MTANEYIYLYGMTLITTSHRLATDFPKCDNYCEINESHRLPGGETGTCAIVLANLDLNVQIDGNFLGRSTYPELIKYFDSSKVSLELMTFDPDFEGLEDMVFIDQYSRTGFGRFCHFFADHSIHRWNQPNEAAIKQAKVVGLDPFFFDDSVEVARLCSKHKVNLLRLTTITLRRLKKSLDEWVAGWLHGSAENTDAGHGNHTGRDLELSERVCTARGALRA